MDVRHDESLFYSTTLYAVIVEKNRLSYVNREYHLLAQSCIPEWFDIEKIAEKYAFDGSVTDTPRGPAVFFYDASCDPMLCILNGNVDDWNLYVDRIKSFVLELRNVKMFPVEEWDTHVYDRFDLILKSFSGKNQ